MSRGLPWAVAVLGMSSVVGGVVLFVVGNQPGDFGWTAYSPAPSEAYRSTLELTFDDGPAVLWTQTSVLGAGLAVLGLLLLAGLAGWAIGVRSRNGIG